MARQHRPSIVGRSYSSPCGVSLERLESRVMMAVTVSVSRRGRINIIAPPGDTVGDVVEVVPFSGHRDIQVIVNNVPAVLRRNADNPFVVRRTKIRRIVADMGGGDDEVYVGVRKGVPRPFRNRMFEPCTLSGGDGNDTLQGGAQTDLLIGGAGDDILYGDRGKDLIFGGSGNDTVFAENGRDNLFGQDGNDFLHGGGNDDALYGMAGADDLIGAEGFDFLNPGNDPGDTRDRNEKPDAGETKDVAAYVEKLIHLAVPDRFRAGAKA